MDPLCLPIKRLSNLVLDLSICMLQSPTLKTCRNWTPTRRNPLSVLPDLVSLSLMPPMSHCSRVHQVINLGIVSVITTANLAPPSLFPLFEEWLSLSIWGWFKIFQALESLALSWVFFFKFCIPSYRMETGLLIQESSLLHPQTLPSTRLQESWSLWENVYQTRVNFEWLGSGYGNPCMKRSRDILWRILWPRWCRMRQIN